MRTRINNRAVLFLSLAIASVLVAQDTKVPAAPPPAQPSTPLLSSDGWVTKTFDLKYIDPDQIRNVYSGQSQIIEVDRDLKLLTVHSSARFVKEIEDLIKRLDVPPPLPPNIQITIYLLAAAPQAPSGVAPPAELKPLEKEIPAKLADMQMFRSRAGQSGETSAAQAPTTPAVSLSRVKVDSSSVNPGAKGDIVSLNGLKVWISLPPTDPNSPSPKLAKNEPDINTDIDLAPNEPVVLAKIGVDKPIVVVVWATVTR